MPVRRPFIKFDISSLKSIGESGPSATKNIYTEPKGFGYNPTISTIINFDCLLPEDLTLIPSLSVNKNKNVLIIMNLFVVYSLWQDHVWANAANYWIIFSKFVWIHSKN